MGCDIHIWAEVRNPDGVWELVRGSEERIAQELQEWTEENETDQERQRSMQRALMRASDIDTEGRNYWLYGILSRVRIVDVPFSFVTERYEVRGTPDDASPEYKAEVEHWDGDGHSHSWLTLRELLEWPHWHAVAGDLNDHEDPVYKAVFDRFRERLQAMTDDTGEGDWPRPPTRPMTCAQVAGKFYSEMMPRLVALGEPDDVRIVFFYDN